MSSPSDDKGRVQSEQAFEHLDSQPLSHLEPHDKARAEELAAALERAEKEPSRLDKVKLSNRAKAVLIRAVDLAPKGEVTPLMILASFVREGEFNHGDSANLIRNMARSIPEFGEWVERVEKPRVTISFRMEHPGLSRPLNRALVYSRFTGAREHEVHTRHLAAAILAPTGRGFSQLEEQLLQQYKVPSDVITATLTQVRKTLAMELAGSEQKRDPPRSWRIIFELPRLLGQEVEPPEEVPLIEEPVAGVRSDAVDGMDLSDRLNIEPDVNALASIIAARSVEPPLAIGLFGDWGTGKSFFMSKMEKRLRDICHREPVTDSGGQPYYFSNIAQIRFNAWHYSDGNLWASLMARIFEGLSLYGIENGREDVQEKLSQQLRSAEFVLGDAQAQLAAAQARRQQAELHARNVHQRQRAVEEEFLRRAGAGALDKVRKDLSTQISARWPQFGPKELLKWQAQLHEPWGKIKELWTWVRQAGRQRVILLLLGVLVSAASSLIVLGLKEVVELSAAVQVLSAVGGLLTPVVGWLAFALPKLNNVLKSLDVARKEIDSADAHIAEELRKKLMALEKEEARAREVALKASKEVERIKTDLNKADPAHRLRDFLAERNESGDYRRHLGLVSLIRNDLSALSDLLRNANDTESAGLPAIDRIVLYIDDLDRCPEERIVQVLEAVHLLLAFPLFVVVVGVDSRWLLHALKKRYKAFSGTDAATPQAYLEKIFQIPFTLRRMERDGFGQLIDFLLPGAKAVQGRQGQRTPAETEIAGSASPLKAQPPETLVPREQRSQQHEGSMPDPKPKEPGPSPDVEPDPKEVGFIKRMWQLISTFPAPHWLLGKNAPEGQQPHGGAAPVAGPQKPEPSRMPPPAPSLAPKLRPILLELDPKEVEFIKRMWRFIPTPRATNRLANCYRLLRVRVSEEREDAFLGRKGVAEYPLVVLLLATMIGFPEEFSRMLHLARELEVPVSNWGAFKQLFTDDEKLESLTRALEQVSVSEADLVPMKSVLYWLSVVCRFSFHLRDEILDTEHSARSATKRLADSMARAVASAELDPSPIGAGEAAPGAALEPSRARASTKER